MSGAFGWVRNDSHNTPPTRQQTGGWFSRAVSAHKNPRVQKIGPDTPPVSAPKPPPRKAFTQTASTPIPTATHKLVATAANVLIVACDVTGSMGDNPEEIFKRLPLMWQEAVTYLGSDDLEILFICFGDARTDSHAVQVARFGREQELDQILSSFYMNCGGGGQGSETPELVAYYLLQQVDVSQARNVYTWIITDEAGCDRISAPLVRRWLDLDVPSDLMDAKSVFTLLSRRMNLFTILFDTGAYYGAKADAIRPYWERMLPSPEAIVPLNDPRRIVDVMLGTIAAMTGQLALFTGQLKSRQLPTQHGTINVATVMKSIALVGKGTPSDPLHVPGAGTRPLLPGPTAGTKSLLDSSD